MCGDVKVEEVVQPSKMMGWTVEVRNGCEVKVLEVDFDQRIMACIDDEDAKLALIWSLENMTTLREGKKVLVLSLFGWVRGEVKLASELMDRPHVDSGGSIFPIFEADDDRNCWVCSSQINKRCFDMIKDPK